MIENKKYQFFISSTEHPVRRKVIDKILKLDQIPVGMEFFPPNSEESLPYVRNLIGECDCLILLVMTKYGNLFEDEKSFTHLEFIHACEKGLPYIAIIPEDIDSVPIPRSDRANDDAGHNRLKEFINLVKGNKKLCKTWRKEEEIPELVADGIAHIIKQKEMVGWIRDLPIKSEYPKYFDTIKSNLNDLSKKVTRFNQESNGYKLLVYDWIIKNRNIDVQGKSEDGLIIPILQSGEKIVQVFGGLITRLGKGDNYHTLSNLSFWMNDLSSLETNFIEDNLNAIHNEVKIKRIILVEKEVLDNPTKNLSKFHGLDTLISKFLEYISNDERSFSQIQTKFVFIPKEEWKKYNNVPYATIFCNVLLIDNKIDSTSLSENSQIMQITAHRENQAKHSQASGLSISFLDENSKSKIFQYENIFLELNNRQNAMDVYEVHKEINLIDNKLGLRRKRLGNDTFSSSMKVYSIIRCNVLNKSTLYSIFNSAIIQIRDDEIENKYTIIDLQEKIGIAKASDDIKILNESSNWRLFKIDVPHALDMHGVVSSISSEFALMNIPVCLYSVTDGEFLFVHQDNFQEALKILIKRFDIEYLDDYNSPM